jgi:hypothetical protein
MPNLAGSPLEPGFYIVRLNRSMPDTWNILGPFPAEQHARQIAYGFEQKVIAVDPTATFPVVAIDKPAARKRP